MTSKMTNPKYANSATPPVSSKDWRKWKDERKAEVKKWKEGKLMKEFQKQKDIKAAKKLKKEKKIKAKMNDGKQYTVSIALPGSILDNAQSPELRTYLAGQIARAATIYNIDEVIVFNEMGVSNSSTTEGDFDGVGKKGDACVRLARILQYLECPQYLRKYFFPIHSDLKYAGILNPLDATHHVRHDNITTLYREGVVLDKPRKEGKGSYVDVGLIKEIKIDKQLKHGVRVTVEMDNSTLDNKVPKGVVVSPTTPRSQHNVYWGYSVRLANSLGDVFTSATYKYDCLLGTSERGDCVDGVKLKKFKHLLIVFGGLSGLEESLNADSHLQADEPRQLFDHYLNVCPDQGSGTIRTEEAILITLSSLRAKIADSQTPEPIPTSTPLPSTPISKQITAPTTPATPIIIDNKCSS